MAIKKVTTQSEYSALQHSTAESDVTLITEGNQLKYDGVNVEVSIPKENDIIVRDTDGEIHFFTKSTYKAALLPLGWKFVDIYYYGWEDTPLVDMGLPSGVLWSKYDIDLSKDSKLADTPMVYAKSFFSWGNTDGHNPIGNSFSDSYNWGGVNSAEPWYDGQVYGSTPGAELNASFTRGDPDHDAARKNLGGNWRMPSNANNGELFANIDYITADGEIVTAATSISKKVADKRVYVNGIAGLYIRSKTNGKRLFFACSGIGYDTLWYGRGSLGSYWSSGYNSARYARYFLFDSDRVNPQDIGSRYYGFAVRPVQ